MAITEIHRSNQAFDTTFKFPCTGVSFLTRTRNCFILQNTSLPTGDFNVLDFKVLLLL